MASASTRTHHKAVRRRVVLFGGTVQLLSEQPKIGHLDIVRMYYRLGQQFRPHTAASIMGHGTTLLISLDDPTSNGPRYTSITAGQHDSEIRAFLTEIDHDAVRYRIPAVYVAFEHEANSVNHKRLGTPSQFVAAWRHIHGLAARARLNWNTGGRLHWVLILEHEAYFTRSERPHWSYSMGFAASYYAGVSYVDAVAADGYNFGSCGRPEPPNFRQPGDKMVTPGSMFNPVLTWAQQHGNRPVFIAEWASIRYRSATVRPQFIRSMEGYVLAHRSIRGVSYFDTQGVGRHGHGSQPGACNMNVNNDPRSLAALAVMNHALPGPIRHRRG